MKNTIIYVDKEEIRIEFSKHAEERADERNLEEYEVYSLILKMGENLLDLKDGEEFAIIDQESENAIICSINSRDFQLVIDIITVISNEKVYITRGTKIYKVSNTQFIV